MAEQTDGVEMSSIQVDCKILLLGIPKLESCATRGAIHGLASQQALREKAGCTLEQRTPTQEIELHRNKYGVSCGGNV